MTDNRTTELLREFAENAIYCNQFGSLYADEERIAEYAERIEHAVAATLGNDDDYERKMDALVCRLTNGKWSKSRAYSIEFMVSCVDEEYETLHAKELAELGSGTCEVVSSIYHGDELYGYDEIELSCGHGFVWMDDEPPRHCPDCGKAVEQ